MSIRVVTGLPGNGKGLWLADRIHFLLARNKRWFKISGVLRPVYSNIEFSESFWYKHKDYLRSIVDISEVKMIRGADVVLDELGIDFDATRWADLDRGVKAWLFAHEHYGVEIYAAAQDFAQIDVAVRRLTTSLVYASKLFGSRRPHVTKPPVRRVWGIVALTTIDRKDYTVPANEYDTSLNLLSTEFMMIRKRLTSIYNTLQEFVEPKPAPLKHIERLCEVCGFIHKRHI